MADVTPSDVQVVIVSPRPDQDREETALTPVSESISPAVPLDTEEMADEEPTSTLLEQVQDVFDNLPSHMAGRAAGSEEPEFSPTHIFRRHSTNRRSLPERRRNATVRTRVTRSASLTEMPVRQGTAAAAAQTVQLAVAAEEDEDEECECMEFGRDATIRSSRCLRDRVQKRYCTCVYVYIYCAS